MAICKYVNKSYPTQKDFYNLLQYCMNSHKNARYNFKLICDCPLTQYNKILHMGMRWVYYHKYFHKSNRTFCYHYVLAFDLDNEYKQLKKISVDLLEYLIIQLPVFEDANVFISAHIRDDGIPLHFHILVDSINSRTGHCTYIDIEKFKCQIGELLADYSIAVAGYSYRNMVGIMKLGKCAPSDLYEDSYWC